MTLTIHRPTATTPAWFMHDGERFEVYARQGGGYMVWHDGAAVAGPFATQQRIRQGFRGVGAHSVVGAPRPDISGAPVVVHTANAEPGYHAWFDHNGQRYQVRRLYDHPSGMNPYDVYVNGEKVDGPFPTLKAIRHRYRVQPDAGHTHVWVCKCGQEMR